MSIPRVLNKRNRILLKELTKTDFKLRYQGSVLGYLWALLRPLMMFAILYIVFAKLLKIGNNIPHYPVYLLCGTSMWSFFTECTSQGIQAIVQRGDLLRKISFPKYMQHKFAVQVMEIAEKYDQHIYMCNEYEMEHGKEIEKIAKEEVPFNEAIKDLQDEIEHTEKEIQDLLNSKAFRLGKYMTTKKERLNVETVLPPTIKRN